MVRSIGDSLHCSPVAASLLWSSRSRTPPTSCCSPEQTPPGSGVGRALGRNDGARSAAESSRQSAASWEAGAQSARDAGGHALRSEFSFGSDRSRAAMAATSRPPMRPLPRAADFLRIRGRRPNRILRRAPGPPPLHGGAARCESTRVGGVREVERPQQNRSDREPSKRISNNTRHMAFASTESPREPRTAPRGWGSSRSPATRPALSRSCGSAAGCVTPGRRRRSRPPPA